MISMVSRSIVLNSEPVPIVERSWVDSLRAERNATSAVRLLVEWTVPIVARATPIYEVVRRAAADPDVRALLEETRHRRRTDQRMLIEILAQSGHLNDGVGIDSAADAFYGLVNEDVFQLLTGDCEWDVDRFRTWATELMVHQLVGGESTTV